MTIPMNDPSWINDKHKAGETYRCEEASLHILSTAQMFVPCAAPASHRMWSKNDNRHYWMCNMCADHNIRRGMVEVHEEKSA